MNKLSAKKEKCSNNQRGITLFLALVITNLLIVISYALTEIALKSSEFSVSGRDSQVAYYAADSALECALFWDAYTDFSQTGDSLKYGGKFNPTTLATFTCGGRAIGSGTAIQGTTTISRVGGAPISVFGYDFQNGINGIQSCAIVTVAKFGGQTHIESRGFNSCNISNQRRTERGIETTYGTP